MSSRRRSVIAWVPYVVVAVAHVVLLAVESDVAAPTKLLLMPLLALPVVLLADRVRSVAAVATLLAAVFFSWLGDGVGVVVDGDSVLPLMLGFFGVAHLAYIILFTRLAPERRMPRWSLGYLGWWIAMLVVLGPHTGALLPAVAVYGLVLAGTAATSARCGPVVAVGGAFFLASDSLLAFRLFLPDATPGWFGPAVMATYTLGQGLIVAGLLRARGRSVSSGQPVE